MTYVNIILTGVDISRCSRRDLKPVAFLVIVSKGTNLNEFAEILPLISVFINPLNASVALI